MKSRSRDYLKPKLLVDGVLTLAAVFRENAHSTETFTGVLEEEPSSSTFYLRGRERGCEKTSRKCVSRSQVSPVIHFRIDRRSRVRER